MNRVARRLEEEGSITSDTPAHYCYITAKFVFLEHLRRTEHSRISIDELRGSGPASLRSATMGEHEEEAESEEKRLDCLERCLENMEPDSREIIIQYYQGEQRVKIENRRALAERLGITVNALSIRACRLRDKLESCVIKCLAR